ncbi:MAG: 50S ribosomal protein L29 [Candidatus Paceibacterota bacterium]
MDYKGKTKEDLKKILDEKRVALRDIRFAVSGGKSKNVKEVLALRKDIAQILTEINHQSKK